MPRISILIAAYNVGVYIERCLESVLNQSFDDFEAIVVDDASTDETAHLIAGFTQRDARIRVITHPHNCGLHLARRTAVAAAQGAYSFFLDGDDELAPDMLMQLVCGLNRSNVDILHYGLTVVGDSGIHDAECRAFEKFNNTDTPAAFGQDIVRNIYDPARHYAVDWRVTQRAYRTDLLKRAFDVMVSARLERAEDGYECFVISALASSYASDKSNKGYIYHYGCGVTGTSKIDAARYGLFCKQFKACFDATAEFVGDRDDMLRRCYLGFVCKGTELLGNDWRVRVAAEEQAEAAELMASVLGPVAASTEIWRMIRDGLWDVFQGNPDGPDAATLEHWESIASSLDERAGDQSQADAHRRNALRQRVQEIRDEMDRVAWKSTADEQPIRIFVSTHRETALFDSKILQPVQVGCALRSDRFPWALHDDEGENISDLNAMYCELTTQYWAWKNVDAQYYGFCHYRRYFDFSGTRHQENSWGEVIDDRIDADAQERYGLTDSSIARAIEGWDIVTTECKDLTLFPDDADTPYDHYRIAPKLHIEDLNRVIAILKEMHPDFAQDADAFLNGSHSCFCNMFVMRKELFTAYCAWLFPILDRFMRDWDTATYSVEALRTPGHLAERLFNIYLIHLKRTNPDIKHKQVQCVHFENPDRRMPLGVPSVAADPRPTVPVVFAADGKYAPMLTTTIYSMLANANRERCYDVIVLSRDIPGDTQETMRSFFASRFDNVSLRFHDVSATVDAFGLTTSNPHISVETYYRFLVPSELPFYDKVLYLDSDLIVEGDVAELYDTELGDNLLAATRDVDYLGNLNMPDGNRMAYSNEQLHMANPYDYFQAGVLVLNTAAMRALCSTREWLQFAAEPGFIYDDQDVLNVHCEGRVTFLDASWNVMHDCCDRVANVFSFAPADVLRAYQDSRRHPKIRHYAGVDKPWNNVHCEWFDQYWAYARQTPFYERMLCQIDKGAEKVYLPPRAISETSPVRKVLDPLLPYGSRRRELLKKIGRKIRKR